MIRFFLRESIFTSTIKNTKETIAPIYHIIAGILKYSNGVIISPPQRPYASKEVYKRHVPVIVKEIIDKKNNPLSVLFFIESLPFFLY
ncbi:MAG: hypothetical protein ACFFDH_13710 [Promethearchaeota archaeon]